VRSPPDAKAGDDATKLKSLLLASERSRLPPGWGADDTQAAHKLMRPFARRTMTRRRHSLAPVELIGSLKDGFLERANHVQMEVFNEQSSTR
jgi:hypothetical protein